MDEALERQLAHNKYHRMVSEGYSFIEIASACETPVEEVRAVFNQHDPIFKKSGRKPRQLRIDDTLLCKKCGMWKTIAGFAKDASKPFELAYTCKYCRLTAAKQSQKAPNRPQELYYHRIVVERGTEQARLDLDALKQRAIVFEAAIQAQEQQDLKNGELTNDYTKA